MGHLFISYSHKDKAYAHKLQHHLLEMGFEAWIDDRIDFGAHWPHEIEKRLRECDAFILVMSPNSHESEWVQNELMLARELQKRIFPLLLEGETWWHLRTTQYVNVQGGKLPPASFLLDVAEASPRDASREVPAQAEKNGAGGMPNIHFYGDVSGNVIVGDSNQIQAAKLAKDTPAKKENLVANWKPPKIKTGVIVALIGFVGIIIVALLALPSLLAWMEPTPISGQTLTASDDTEITDAKGVAMRLVPAGTFTMGSNALKDEQPVHQVILPNYYMDIYEVTNVLYKACVDAGSCTLPKNTDRYDNVSYATHPVVYVDWTQAKTYCEWRTARLPTEAEWEKAARSTDGRTYPWGNNTPDKTLLNYNSYEGDTTEVGTYPTGKSPYGMYDMAGNAWEWVADWYDETYYGTLGENAFDPQGLQNGTYRVQRGGAWYDGDNDVRSAYRGGNEPVNSYDNFGFRCALSSP